jgi:SPP1 gp7 family putative phage head morphogenesis protein
MKKLKLKLDRKLQTSYQRFIYKPYKRLLSSKTAKTLNITDSTPTFEDLIPLLASKEWTKEEIQFFLDNLSRSIIEQLKIDIKDIPSFKEIEQDLIKDFIEQNLMLISSLTIDTKKELSRIIIDAKNYNQTPKDIIPQIQKLLSATKNRAETIAITELNKLNGKLNINRMKSNGINYAIWSSANDKRVRRCHLARNGVKYSIDEGCFSSCDNKYLQVGQEIRCRCAMSIYIP